MDVSLPPKSPSLSPPPFLPPSLFLSLPLPSSLPLSLPPSPLSQRLIHTISTDLILVWSCPPRLVSAAPPSGLLIHRPNSVIPRLHNNSDIQSLIFSGRGRGEIFTAPQVPNRVFPNDCTLLSPDLDQWSAPTAAAASRGETDSPQPPAGDSPYTSGEAAEGEEGVYPEGSG